MIIVQPITIDSGNLVSSNATNEAFDWAIGSYNLGDQRVYGESVYEALGTTSDRPDIGASLETPTWVRLGYANRWRMFRDGSDSRTDAAGEINVTFTSAVAITTIAVLGLQAATVQVIVTDDDDGEIYNETKSAADIGVEDWWEYYFLDYESISSLVFEDIPPYAGATIQIIVDSGTIAGTAECGRVVAGVNTDIGVTLEGSESRIEDFSVKSRDSFGNLSITQRRTIRIVDFDFVIEPENVDYTQRRFAAFAGGPALFIGRADMPETVVFGVYESFRVILNGHTITECSVTVQEF